MASSDEQQELEDLIASPGWRRFVTHMMRDIDARFLSGVETILGQSESASGDHLREIQAFAAQRVDRRELSVWPDERVKMLRRETSQRKVTPRFRT